MLSAGVRFKIEPRHHANSISRSGFDDQAINPQKTGYLFPMADQQLSVRDRLVDWVEKYGESLGKELVEAATRITEVCYLSHEIFQDRDAEDTNTFPFPSESVLSVTRFGNRPRARPQTTRPAEFAALILKNALEEEASYEFLEALLGRAYELDKFEFQKRLRTRHQEAVEVSRYVADALTCGVTSEQLQREIEEADIFIRQNENFLGPYSQARLRFATNTRLGLLQRIRAGDFDHLEPIVNVAGRRLIGKFRMEGTNAWPKEGMAVQFKFCPNDFESPYRWAFLYSVPAWYPYWVGERQAQPS